MPEPESVSTSLMPMPELEIGAITAVDVEIDGEAESIILRRHGEGLTAWLNVCPHAGRRLDYAPGRFLVDGGNLVCAAHGASFALDSGLCVAGPCRGAHLRAVAATVTAEGELALGPILPQAL